MPDTNKAGLPHASLHQLEGSKRASCVISALLLVCTGLILVSHLGLSAQVVTNAPPPETCAGRRRMQQSTRIGRQLQQTTGCNASDDTLYALLGGRGVDPNNYSAFDAMQDTCGRTCGFAMLNGPSCATDCIRTTSPPAAAGTLFSSACASCIGLYGHCSAVNCTAECIRGASCACNACVDRECSAAFHLCSGFAVPVDTGACTSASGGSPSNFYYSVGGDADISFISALKSLYEANAPFLATLLLLASGVKPYAECLLLALIWFVPLPARIRGQLLRWINRGSRWSLMDHLIVMAIASAIHFSVANGSVDVILETRLGIYTFVTMALVLTPIGEWMTFRNTVHSGVVHEDPAYLGCCNRLLPSALDNMLQRDARRRMSPLLAMMAPLSLGLNAAAIFADYAVEWTIEDHASVPTNVMVTRLSLADLTTSATKPAMSSAAGGWFVGIVYVLVVAVLPIAASAAMCAMPIRAPCAPRLAPRASRLCASSSNHGASPLEPRAKPLHWRLTQDSGCRASEDESGAHLGAAVLTGSESVRLR